MPMLEAALEVINAHREFWPLSVRQIHYRLLGPGAPLKHASKPDSRYENDKEFYKTLTDLLARGRIEGRIPWEAIDDETRPEMTNPHFWNPQDFFKDELSGFLIGYYRNRQQSQRNHIEIIAEKLTVKTILEKVAAALQHSADHQPRDVWPHGEEEDRRPLQAQQEGMPDRARRQRSRPGGGTLSRRTSETPSRETSISPRSRFTRSRSPWTRWTSWDSSPR